MILNFGTNIHRVQLVMELDIAQPDEKTIANRLMQGKSVISIQHFIAGVETTEAAVIVWDGKDLIKVFIGRWKFDHLVNNKSFYENYFQFTPVCEVKPFGLETVNEHTDEYYLYFTFNNYKKL
jgi:hypothetical protein